MVSVHSVDVVTFIDSSILAESFFQFRGYYRGLVLDRKQMPNLKTELALLGLLALLWGSSYLFIKVAVAEIPPLTLIAVRVAGAACFLLVVMKLRLQKLPTRSDTWRKLLVQAFLNGIGAWTVLAWGQQYVDAGLAGVLNSTSPIFVFLITALVTRHESIAIRKLSGAIIGIMGVVLIMGVEALADIGQQIPGQLACLFGAFLYACAAIYGKRFSSLSAVTTAAGTMIWSTIVLVPIALIVDRPWTLSPSTEAILAAIALSTLCSGMALLLYFRLLKTLGSMGVASQAYLRAGVSVFLGIFFLGETLNVAVAIGSAMAIVGVIFINWPLRRHARMLDR